MKAYFSFDLPEELEEYDLYRNGPEFFGIISRVDESLRRAQKDENHPWNRIDREVLFEQLRALLGEWD